MHLTSSPRADSPFAPTDFGEAGRPDVDAYRIFSEPVTVVTWRDQDKINKLLSRVILTHEKCDAGVKRSNNGGWHSHRNIFKSPSWEIGELKRRIVFALSVTKTKLKINMKRDALDGWHFSGWANVSRRGHWNALHYHGKAVWTVIYYVNVGSESRPPQDPGHLILYDLQQLKKWAGNGELPANTQTHRILPVPGRMILFPGQMWHRTDVFSGPGARVSIAFNLS